MKQSYEDISKRIKTPPLWWDCNGVPRYARFHHHFSPNIYAHEVVLYEVQCQACGREFKVEGNWRGPFHNPLSELVRTRALHYKDPPAHNCTGDTMNSIPCRTVQFWRKDSQGEWERVPALEGVDIRPDWADYVNADE